MNFHALAIQGQEKNAAKIDETCKQDVLAETIKFTLLGLFMLTPIFTLGDIFNFFFYLNVFDLRSIGVIHTPWYVKSIKDLLLITAFILGLIRIIRLGRLKFFLKTALLPAFVVGVLFWLSFQTDRLAAFAGLRWIAPLALIPIFSGLVDASLLKKIAWIFGILLFVSFTIQIAQILFIPYLGINEINHLLGDERIKWIPRVAGLFVSPSTTGFFSCVTAFLCYFYVEKGRFQTYAILISCFSILLAGTVTAVIALGSSAIYVWLKKKWRILPIISVSALLGIVFLAAPILTGRARGNISFSGNMRKYLFIHAVKQAEYISTQFGKSTNTYIAAAINVRHDPRLLWKGQGYVRQRPLKPGEWTPSLAFFPPNLWVNPKGWASSPLWTVDSTVTMLLANLGIIPFAIFISFYLFWIICVIKAECLAAFIFTLMYTLFSLTTSTFEAFPMNVLLSLGIAYYMEKFGTASYFGFRSIHAKVQAK